MVKHTTGIDLYDRASQINEREIRRRHRQLGRLRVTDAMTARILRRPPAERTMLQRHFLNRAPKLRYHYWDRSGWLPSRDIHRLKMRQRPSLDRYLQMDLFDLEERFDLITSFSSLEWFKADEVFPKIASLLRESGCFYLWAPNWWAPVTTTLLAGHFPYASQRLTKDEFMRYAKEHLPDHAEAMEGNYNYFDPTHPTIRDYMDCGVANGLMPIWHKENVLPHLATRKRGMTARAYFERAPADVRDAIEDIRRFRPDIHISDLLAHSHVILFQRVPDDKRLEAEDIEEFRNMVLGGGDAKGPGEILRRVGKAVERSVS